MNEDQNGLCDEFEQQLFYGYCKSQVTQYNEILMDPDDFRRYERLDSIKDKFIAWRTSMNIQISIASFFHRSRVVALLLSGQQAPEPSKN